MKKKLMAVLAIVLVIAMSVAGTYAYLTANTGPVTNTFTAASGVVEEGTLKLEESEAALVNGVYVLDKDQKCQGNTYNKVVPGMNIDKDPALSADVVDGVNAYIFVEVVDNGSKMSYNLTSDWVKLVGVTGANGGAVYVYKDAVINGDANKELANVQILVDNQVTAAADVKDLNGGTITFYGYACQADGFNNNAANAYKTCFLPPVGE